MLYFCHSRQENNTQGPLYHRQLYSVSSADLQQSAQGGCLRNGGLALLCNCLATSEDGIGVYGCNSLSFICFVFFLPLHPKAIQAVAKTQRRDPCLTCGIVLLAAFSLSHRSLSDTVSLPHPKGHSCRGVLPRASSTVWDSSRGEAGGGGAGGGGGGGWKLGFTGRLHFPLNSKQLSGQHQCFDIAIP